MVVWRIESDARAIRLDGQNSPNQTRGRRAVVGSGAGIIVGGPVHAEHQLD